MTKRLWSVWFLSVVIAPWAPALSAEEQKEFIAVTSELKTLNDRRDQILARVGDEYVTDPPKVQAKP